jgi:hydrogenase maturation protease
VNFATAERIVGAVLYEGYILYPYRPSAIKNQQRWTFGGVYPPGFPGAGASSMESQCLAAGEPRAQIEVRVRFLQPILRQIYAAPAVTEPRGEDAVFSEVPSLSCEGRTYYTWEEAIEREIRLPQAALEELARQPRSVDFEFPAERTAEPIAGREGVAGRVVRTREAIRGAASVAAMELEPGIYRLTLRMENSTPGPLGQSSAQAAGSRAFMSTHMVAGISGGHFVSIIDPPARFTAAARACTNEAAWPILVGDHGASDTLLCSPIILYDHPQIAPESPGDLFDGTEIDEILTLRILTMTDAEKSEMAATDERARALLARTEALTQDQLLQLHGAMRNPGTQSLQVGAHVRLNPKIGADIMDLALAGQTAVIEALEVDFDNRIHVAVTIDADPGRDLGSARMPGHRFFFSPDEIEPVGAGEARP